MESVSLDSNAAGNAAIQAAENATKNTESSNTQAVTQSNALGDEFSKLMRKALGETKTEVSEEELFAAIIQERLQAKNADAAAYYEEQVASLKTAMARPDGKVSMEDVGKAALKATVDAGKVELSDAEIINAKAFSAAQLDDDASALFDAYGGADDPTRAVESVEAAMTKIQLALEELESGKTALTPLSLDTPSNTIGGGMSYGDVGDFGEDGMIDLLPTGPAPTGEQALDGSGGFLWKPQSEKDGKLAVILPESFTGLVTKLEIHRSLPASEETKIEEGNYSGVGNGGREHFRFGGSGDSYGNNIYVVATNADGTQASWKIEDGAARND